MSAPALAALGRTSLSAAVMILAVLVLRLRFQRRTPQRVFCLLWDLVLVRLLLPLELRSPFSVQRLLGCLSGGRQAASAVLVTDTGFTALEQDAVLYFQEGTAILPGRAVELAPVPDGSVPLAALWLLGLFACAAWFLWGHLRSRRVYDCSLPLRSAAVLDWQAAHPLRRPVQVRRSDRIASPLTYGTFYPVVLLPSAMDLDDAGLLDCVLSHEYTHIRRFDSLRKGLLAAGACLHWFNPLVWVMYVLACRDMELACDEAVIRAGADRRSYALALLRLEEERGFLSGSSFSRNALEERIKAIMKIKKFSVTALIALLAAMSIATTVFATSAPEPEGEPVSGGVQGATRVMGTEETITKDILSRSDGKGNTIYSDDGGETWMTEEAYHAKYGSYGADWTVEWWTAEDYAAWLEQEKEELQDMIGERGYNPTDGWFTWDQKKVDETIALYENILKDIQNGALHSKTITDKDGNTIDDVALGSDGILVAQCFDSADMVEIKPDDVEQQREDLFQECAPFGLTGNEKDGFFYKGQRVRAFVDGYGVADNGYAVRYAYYDEIGTVDLHTVRAYVRWADGSYDPSGDLTALVTAGDEGFDQGLADCALPSTGVGSTLAEGNSGFTAGNHRFADDQFCTAAGNGGGKSLEEIFTQYEAYGLACTPGEGSYVDLTYNGQQVRSFADLKPDGSAFTYQNPFADGGIALRTQYDGDGNLTGLSADTLTV